MVARCCRRRSGRLLFPRLLLHAPPVHRLGSAGRAIGHGARWLCIAGLGWSMPAAALVDCLLVAAILAPVCFHKHLPFAGVGFAAVVALVPGVFLFRAFSGIFQIAAGDTSLVTLGATAQDAASALLIILAMAIGIALPHEFWLRRMHRDRKI